MWTPYALETRYELIRLSRLPGFAIPTLAFPLMFYLLFGIMMAGSRAVGGRDLAPYLLGSYGAFGVIGASLFSFGISVATERAQGWFLLKRATPMPPMAYVVGKVGASMVFGAVIVLGLGLCGAFLGGVRLATVQWALLGGVLVLGSIPFCAIGLAIGFLAGPNSAPAIVNLLHLPAAFASGLWIPLEILPSGFRTIAPWLPQYHLGQLALGVMGLSPSPRPGWNAMALLVWGSVAVAAAAIAYRRDEGKLYG